MLSVTPKTAYGSLVLLATALAGLVVYHSFRLVPGVDAGAPPPWTSLTGPAAVALAACLTTLLALLVAGALMRRERARRRRADARLSRLLQAADQADTLVAIVNRRGRIEYVNRAVEAATGFSPDELVGQRHAQGLPWHIEGPALDEAWATVLSGGSFRGPVEGRRKDGAPLLLEETLAPLHEGQGRAARFVSTARDVTRERRLEDRLAYLTRFDPLTGVPNRGHFAELLQAELEQRSAGRRVDLMVVDVDRFKYINDLHSPEVGDAVLRELVEILRAHAGSPGIIGRLGSDEFGLIHRRSRETDIYDLAESIRAVVSQPTDPSALWAPVTVTAGIASSPQDGNDAVTLLKRADMALARAKSLGRGSIQAFNRELSDQALELHLMERQLACALRRGEYDLHYQPYCELSSGRPVGAEALIRWSRGRLGFVSPAKFIPALEDSGLMLAVGEWVLRTACRQIGSWRETRRGLPLAVNISDCQFGRKDLARTVSRALEEFTVDPSSLTLELTEMICLRDEAFAIAQLERLKDVGVSIAVDDFGTGFSSLSHIKRLPVDVLKIDRSFVDDVTREPDAASIISAITSMARGLGVKTIAEGVETEEQRNVLHLLRCDMGQGYRFNPPLAADEFERRVAC